MVRPNLWRPLYIFWSVKHWSRPFSLLPPRCHCCRSRACPASCSSARSSAHSTWATTACSLCRRASASWRRWRSWSWGATAWSACRWSSASVDSSRGRAWWWRRTSLTHCPPRSRNSSGKLIRSQPELPPTDAAAVTQEPRRLNWRWSVAPVVSAHQEPFPVVQNQTTDWFRPILLFLSTHFFFSFHKKHFLPSHHNPVLMVFSSHVAVPLCLATCVYIEWVNGFLQGAGGRRSNSGCIFHFSLIFSADRKKKKMTSSLHIIGPDDDVPAGAQGQSVPPWCQSATSLLSTSTL